MSEAQVLTTRINADDEWEVDAQTVDSLGNTSPATGFGPSDAIEAIVWGGEDQSQLLALAGTWIDASNGKFQLAVSATQTATGFSAGSWPLEVTILPTAGGRVPVFDGWFTLTDSPGSNTTPPVYCTVQDMLDIAAAWLPQLRIDAGLANFTAQRAKARQHLDKTIVAAYRPQFNRRRDLLFNSSLMIGPLEAPNPTILGYLASNFLMTADGMAAQITAHKAIAYVCETQFTFDEGDPYPMRARYHHLSAGNLIKGYRAALDINADGQADLAFNLGVISCR